MDLNTYVESLFGDLGWDLKYFNIEKIAECAKGELTLRKDGYKPYARHHMGHVYNLTTENYEVAHEYAEKIGDLSLQQFLASLENESITDLFEIIHMVGFHFQETPTFNFKYNQLLVQWAYEEIEKEDPDEIVIKVDERCQIPRHLAHTLWIPEKDWSNQSRDRLIQWLDEHLEYCDCVTDDDRILASDHLELPLRIWFYPRFGPLSRSDVHKRFFYGLWFHYGHRPLTLEIFNQLNVPDEDHQNKKTIWQHVLLYLDRLNLIDQDLSVLSTKDLPQPLHDYLNPECLCWNNNELIPLDLFRQLPGLESRQNF